MFKYIRKISRDIKKKLKPYEAQVLNNTKFKLLDENLISLKDNKKFTYKSFGNLNNRKKFYVIRRYPSAGFFSNITYVLNHLKLCDRLKYIPVVDMENYPTIYNELKNIKQTKNSWEYFFKKLNKYSLSEVYKSKNVYLSKLKFEKNMSLDMTDNSINKQFKKIKIKKDIILKSEKFYKKNLKKKSFKVLGIHLRGSTYKTARGHAFPPTPKLMIEHVNKLIKKYNYKKLFLVTEEKKYLNKFIRHFGNKCIFYNSYRMSNVDSFKVYPRKNHRYKLGEEILIEAIILSKCDGLTFIKSNVISAAINFSKKKIRLHEIFLGHNSRNRLIAGWLWYLKKYLPKNLYGLKILKTYEN